MSSETSRRQLTTRNLCFRTPTTFPAQSLIVSMISQEPALRSLASMEFLRGISSRR